MILVDGSITMEPIMCMCVCVWSHKWRKNYQLYACAYVCRIFNWQHFACVQKNMEHQILFDSMNLYHKYDSNSIHLWIPPRSHELSSSSYQTTNLFFRWCIRAHVTLIWVDYFISNNFNSNWPVVCCDLIKLFTIFFRLRGLAKRDEPFLINWHNLAIVITFYANA